MTYENATVDAEYNGLKVADTLYTMDVIPNKIKMRYNNKIGFVAYVDPIEGWTGGDQYEDNFINITIDNSIQKLNHVIMGNGEHRFYCGSIDTADDGDLVMKISNSRVDFYKDIYLNDQIFTGGGSSNPFNEDVIIANTYKLKTDTITTNGFNDLVFEVESLGEYLRFNSTNFQIKVPDNRYLISKNFFSDIIKPLTIVDDISFQGQNTAGDSYEEYLKINSTNKNSRF